ncbi:MAG: hypothetical protein GZ094_21385 [Mariniphaga sp.]|nr:hypothetical protein [Mariniphaga sp.]
MEARSISKGVVLSVVQQPDQILQQDQSTTIYSKLIAEMRKYYL